MSRLHLEAIMRNVDSWNAVRSTPVAQSFELGMMHINLTPEETIAAWEWFYVGWISGTRYLAGR